MRILAGYKGGVFDERIVEIYNKTVNCMGEPVVRYRSVEEFRSLWLNYSTYRPENMGILVYAGTPVAFVYVSMPGDRVGIHLYYDTDQPDSIIIRADEKLVSWALWKAREYRASIAYVSAGCMYSPLYMFLSRLLPSRLLRCWGHSMIYSGEPMEPPHVEGIVVRRAGPEDARYVVEVYNDAFRGYPWFEEWREEDAVKWYRSRRLDLFIAFDEETGEAVGFVDGEYRVDGMGRKYGYVYTLAVKNKYRGRGIGKLLLRTLTNYYLTHGAYAVLLDAVGGVEKFYLANGFKILCRRVAYILHTITIT